MVPGQSQRFCVERAQNLLTPPAAHVITIRVGTIKPLPMSLDDQDSKMETMYHSTLNAATVEPSMLFKREANKEE